MSGNNEEGDSGNGGGGGGDETNFVIRVRGLPWSTTPQEVADFFEESSLARGVDSCIHLTLTRDGRPSGEAYIEFASQQDAEAALKKDRQTMGKRYIEVYEAKYSEMQWVLQRSGAGSGGRGASNFSSGSDGDNVVRLRGLPFECSRDDIYKFFEGLEIANNGILMTTDNRGRSMGEAFVQFTGKNFVDKALEKNKQSIGRRYIEIFRSSMAEANRNQMGGGGSRGGPGRGGRGGGGYGGGFNGGYGGGGMRGRPGPYDRQGGGRDGGYGAGFGPGGPRGSRNYKSFGDDNNYYNSGGGNNSFGGGNCGNGNGRGGGGYGGNGGGGNSGYGGGGGYGNNGGGNGNNSRRHVVHMRGLPFRITENDIAEWFSSVVDPVDISIIYNNQGRPAGEADVLFASEGDARKAMSKDRQNMQHRYVELFYDGPTGGGGGGGGNNGPPSHHHPPMGQGYGRGPPQPLGGMGGGGGGGFGGNGYNNY